MRLIDADALINELNRIKAPYRRDIDKAIEDAPITIKTCEVDIISREDAIEAVASRDETDGTVKVFTGRQVYEILSALPSVEADYEWTEIVRCNDCKHYVSDGGAIMYCEHTDIPTDKSDYCSYGERIEE